MTDEAFDPNQPEPGYYRRRLVRGGPWVAVRIWRGFGRCPHTGDILERGWQLRCTVAGADANPFDQWLWVCREPITEQEFKYLTDIKNYAVEHEPDLPEATPRSAVDFNKIQFNFGRKKT